MKKQLRKLATGVLAAGLVLAMAVPAMAALGPGVQTGNSDAVVTFTSPSGAQALYLETVPELDFDSHLISVDDMYYAAKTTAHPLEVVELRGTKTGFKVKVGLNQFFDSSSTAGLAGAQISFKAITGAPVIIATSGVLHTSSAITASATPLTTTYPAAQAVTMTAAATPTEHIILQAAAGTANNRWGAHWMGDAAATENANTSTSKDVELMVLFGTNNAETYTAKMDWTLEDTP